LATLLFAPTKRAEQRLIEAGHPRERIVFTGNTVIDALNIVALMPCSWAQSPLASIPQDKRLVFVTAHRRESLGKPLRRIFEAIRELASLTAPMGVHFVCPVHRNPAVRQTAEEILAGTDNVTLHEPLDYLCTIHLLGRSELVITDSGGLQEEAPALGVPVLVLRDETERPEGLEAGVSRLVGTECAPIVVAAYELLTRPDAAAAMARRSSLYGDGRAAGRIVTALLDGQAVVERPTIGSRSAHGASPESSPSP
jgi:UDP-N-acetylglucosamine 2-epimerase